MPLKPWAVFQPGPEFLLTAVFSTGGGYINSIRPHVHSKVLCGTVPQRWTTSILIPVRKKDII